MYNPIVDTCIVSHTHSGLVNAIDILVADVVLLLTMLIGLLRHAHRSSTGIWKLLYQQVTLKNVFSVLPVPRPEFLVVHNLVSFGLDCRDTSCGLSRSLCRHPLLSFDNIQHFIFLALAGLPHSRFGWCVCVFSHVRP